MLQVLLYVILFGGSPNSRARAHPDRTGKLDHPVVSQSIQRALKNRKKLFSPYKIIDSENFIKVSQNPNKVARDTQGLPTVPHNDFGGLNFKGLASKYLLLMATSPYKITFSKKNHEKNLLESEKTSNSALSGVVRIEIWSSF